MNRGIKKYFDIVRVLEVNSKKKILFSVLLIINYEILNLYFLMLFLLLLFLLVILLVVVGFFLLFFSGVFLNV